MPLTSPDRARTVCGSLLAGLHGQQLTPPRGCFPLCSVASQRGSLPGPGLGRAATATRRCDEKRPRSLERNKSCCCCCCTTSSTTRESQDDAPSRAQDRPGPRPPAPAPVAGKRDDEMNRRSSSRTCRPITQSHIVTLILTDQKGDGRKSQSNSKKTLCVCGDIICPPLSATEEVVADYVLGDGRDVMELEKVTSLLLQDL